MLLSPGAWLAAFCTLGAILLALGLRRLGAGFTAVGVLGFVAVITLPLDQWALAPLENRFPAPGVTSGFDGILVLGGALETALTQDRARPSLNASSERLIEFVALARKYPEAKLAFTGGPLPNRPDGPPEADGARQLFETLGLSADRVTFESQSLTTRENAVLSLQKIKPDPAQKWLLLTSAAHMPRAIGAFRAVGWNVTAYPVGYKTFLNTSLRATRGFGERMALLDIASHEWVGLLYYRLTSRVNVLFPSP